MSNERIAIITGGDSSERKVGLVTAASVANSLKRLGVHHQVFEVNSFQQLLELNLADFTRVFIALHGGFGENGILQAYLEGIRMPYNGPSPGASAICMDKLLTKYVAAGLGIHVPKFIFSPNGSQLDLDLVRERFGDCFIVKPNGEGCSIGVSLIKGNFGGFDQAVDLAASFGRGVLVEEFLEGQELSVCYFFGEMLPSLGVSYEQEIFSFEAKYESEHTKKWFLDLADDIRERVERDGKAIAQALGLDYYRNDVIISDGIPYLIEINTLPGLTDHSLFPRACAQTGVGFDQLIQILNEASPQRPSSSRSGGIVHP